MPYLPVGEYTFTAQAPAFADTVRKVQLTVGAAFDVTLQLRIGFGSTTLTFTLLFAEVSREAAKSRRVDRHAKRSNAYTVHK